VPPAKLIHIKQFQTGIDNSAVIRAALALPDFFKGDVKIMARPVRTMGDYRLDHVGDRNDLGLVDDLIGVQSVRVAAAM